jgi:hypothetical protein
MKRNTKKAIVVAIVAIISATAVQAAVKQTAAQKKQIALITKIARAEASAAVTRVVGVAGPAGQSIAGPQGPAGPAGGSALPGLQIAAVTTCVPGDIDGAWVAAGSEPAQAGMRSYIEPATNYNGVYNRVWTKGDTLERFSITLRVNEQCVVSGSIYVPEIANPASVRFTLIFGVMSADRNSIYFETDGAFSASLALPNFSKPWIRR